MLRPIPWPWDPGTLQLCVLDLSLPQGLWGPQSQGAVAGSSTRSHPHSLPAEGPAGLLLATV